MLIEINVFVGFYKQDVESNVVFELRSAIREIK
jgi:hypothetical protein